MTSRRGLVRAIETQNRRITALENRLRALKSESPTMVLKAWLDAAATLLEPETSPVEPPEYDGSWEAVCGRGGPGGPGVGNCVVRPKGQARQR